MKLFIFIMFMDQSNCKGKMSTVIGIFENHYKKKTLPVVRPGTQTRRFTHIMIQLDICYLAWKKNLCRHYSIANKKYSY